MDYEASPAHSNIEINVVHFSEEYYAISEEEEAALLDFGQSFEGPLYEGAH